MQADGSKISPIEVKSSGYKSHASLDQFSEKYSSDRPVAVYTKDLKKDGNVLCLPIYMVLPSQDQDLLITIVIKQADGAVISGFNHV